MSRKPLTSKARSIARQPSSSDTWRQFERALALALTDVGDEEYLVISTRRGNRFVQFAGEGAFGMRTEAVSNTYLGPRVQLSPEQCATLDHLGWLAPTYDPGLSNQHQADGSPNFYLDIATPVPHSRVARLAIRTLREVYGVRHPFTLEYRAFTRAGESIRFPGLKIRRQQTPQRNKAPNITIQLEDVGGVTVH